MPFYETTVVIDSTLQEAAINEKVERYVALLTDAGAKEIRQDRRGVRRLAYEIKGKDGEMRSQADYTFLFYEAQGTAVKSVEEQFRLDEDVLRYMTIRYDREPVAPSDDEESDRRASDDDDDNDADSEG